MGPKTEELLNVLESFIQILNNRGEEHWAEWMENSKREISNSDFHGIERLLSAYGGMGSINDISDPETQKLSSRVFSLAEQIKNSQD